MFLYSILDFLDPIHWRQNDNQVSHSNQVGDILPILMKTTSALW